MNLKIQVGVGSKEEFEYFLSKGADEFYCGFSKIPSHVYGGTNFETISEIEKAIKAARVKKRKFFLAANEIQPKALNETKRAVKTLLKSGLDGVIVKDIALLNDFKNSGIQTNYILSTLSYCFNLETLEFYKDRGIKRIALPEQIKPSEAEELIKNKWGIKTEVFFKAREYCVNFNGLCFLQFGERNACFCRKAFKKGKEKFLMPEPEPEEHFSDLYDFCKLGAGILKIGRSPRNEMAKIIFRQLVMTRKLLEQNLSKKDFIAKSLKIHVTINKFFGLKRPRR